MSMFAIPLPWGQKYWQLYITHFDSTEYVWARLFGEEFNKAFNELLDKIDMYMAGKRARPLYLTLNRFYLIWTNGGWQRVLLEELDKPNANAHCVFVDFGYGDWVPIKELYTCDTQFLNLPAQAVRFSLFGLEDFECNINTLRHLEVMLLNKSVIGKILTSRKDFCNKDSTSFGKIQVVLYDTSSDDDVNLNSDLLKKICDDTHPPDISKQGFVNVQVSHVSDEGYLYIQIMNTDFEYVQTLLKKLVASKFNSDQHKITRTDLNTCQIFLILDDNSSEPQWYRATLVKTDLNEWDEEFDMHYIDHGVTRRTHISKMFCLESLSRALSKFPGQAIKTQLYNVPPLTKGNVTRLRTFLPPSCSALVKMNKRGELPYITVYRCVDISCMLCNINENMRMESNVSSEGSDNDGINDTSSKNNSCYNLPSPPCSKFLLDMAHGRSINYVDDNPPKIFHKLKNYDEFPLESNEFFQVRVALSANPSSFTIQPYKYYQYFREMLTELQVYYENYDVFIPTDMIEIGEAYVAKSTDGLYQRVIVLNIWELGLVHIVFCDFGDHCMVRNDQLKILPGKFRKLPKMAMQAKLYAIKPISGDWTLPDCARFHQLTRGQKFNAIVKNISKNNLDPSDLRLLELELMDITTGREIYIKDIFLKEHRAVYDTIRVTSCAN